MHGPGCVGGWGRFTVQCGVRFVLTVQGHKDGHYQAVWNVLLVWQEALEGDGRLHSKCDGTRWHMGGEEKGKLVNGLDSQYSSHYLGTWCSQHYYHWCAHLGCRQSTEQTPSGWFKWTRLFRAKDEIWFLRVSHKILLRKKLRAVWRQEMLACSRLVVQWEGMVACIEGAENCSAPIPHLSGTSLRLNC